MIEGNFERLSVIEYLTIFMKIKIQNVKIKIQSMSSSANNREFVQLNSHQIVESEAEILQNINI